MSSNSYLEREFEGLINSIFKGIVSIVKVFFLGIRKLFSKKSNLLFFFMWVVIGWALIRFRVYIWRIIPDSKYSQHIKKVVWIGFALPGIYLYYLGEQYRNFRDSIASKFEEIGFYSGLKKVTDSFSGEVNEIKNTPLLIKMEKNGIKVLYTYKSNIPLQEWKKRGYEIETLLDLHIVDMQLAKKSKQIITLHTIPADHSLGDYVPWDNQFVRLQEKGKFELVFGLSMLEEVSFDLVKNPHILIAGLTGSGKSVLETCLAWQCIRKGAHVFLVDFKGGMEFGIVFEEFGEVISERKRVIEVLRRLVEENTLRMALLRREELNNLEDYNQKYPKSKLARVILLCDEVAEMLDKEGADKEEKKEIDEIAKLMSSIARLSRAPGLNMILATQRPDAKVITGQIKANLPVRVSGKMVDDYNSEMVLGNTKATEIDAKIKGRFMYSMGVETHEFQAYAFNKSYMEQGKYKLGRMLIDGNNITESEIEAVLDPVEVEDEDPEKLEKKSLLKSIFKVKKKDPEIEAPKIEQNVKSYGELTAKPKVVVTEKEPVHIETKNDNIDKNESKLIENTPEDTTNVNTVEEKSNTQEKKVIFDGHEFESF